MSSISNFICNNCEYSIAGFSEFIPNYKGNKSDLVNEDYEGYPCPECKVGILNENKEARIWIKDRVRKNESSFTSNEDLDEDFHGKNTKSKKTTKTQIAIFFLVLIGFFTATTLGFMIYAFPKFLISKYLLKNKNAKSNILRDTIIAGLVLGVISLIGQNATNQNKPVSNKEPTEIRTTKNDNDEELVNTLYRNIKYGFRIKFPEGWSIKKGDGIHVVQKAVLGNSTISVMVQQFDLGASEKITSIKDTGTAKEYIDNVIEGAKLKTSDVKVIDYGETKIDNEPAYWVEYSGTYQALDKKVNMTNIIYFIAKGNTAYSISAGTATNEYQDLKPTFTRTVSTFVLEKYE